MSKQKSELQKQLKEVNRQFHSDEISIEEFARRSEDILDTIDQIENKGMGRMGFIKKAFIVGCVVVGIGGCTSLMVETDKAKPSKKVETPVSKQETPETERPSSAPKNDGVTQETFDLIQDGNVMDGSGGTSFDAVQGMIAVDPLTKVSANVMGVETVTYTWLHFESGSSITVSFVNGKSVSKVFSAQ